MRPSLPHLFLLLSATVHWVPAQAANDTEFEVSEKSGVSAISQQIDAIGDRLQWLPEIPQENSAGSGGGMIYILEPIVQDDAPFFQVEVKWEEERLVDLIVLIPARFYGILGLDMQYTMPMRYDLQLLDADGEAAGALIKEHNAWEPDSPQGYPHSYKVTAPKMAQSLRIRVYELAPTLNPAEARRAAWAEVFCFEGDYNVALNAEISSTPETWAQVWRWNTSFLVDGITGMGFPQRRLQQPDTFEIGWLSHSHAVADTEGWIELDLGQSEPVDGLRLFPAIRPSLSHIPGLGIPRRFQVFTSETGAEGDWELWIDREPEPVPNPGQHPAEFRAELRNARYIRLEASEFWKVSDFYPAFIGFSEIQVLRRDANVAEGATVRVFELSEQIPAETGYQWSPASMVDGESVRAEILPMREWLELLVERRDLEKRLGVLLGQRDDLQNRRLDYILWSGIIIGTLGLSSALFVLFRSRRRILAYRRELKLSLAGDLHDDLGSNLGCILSLSKSIETDESRATSYAPRIRQMTAESLESIRDLVQTYRGESMVEGEVIKRIHATAERMLPTSIEFTFYAAPEVEKFTFSATDRRNLLLFLREALHNCIQHSQASEVTIQMTLSGLDCVLMMRDNGIGITPEILKKEYTLFALRARAKELGATFEPDSRPNHGLTLTLTLPHKKKIKTSL